MAPPSGTISPPVPAVSIPVETLDAAVQSEVSENSAYPDAGDAEASSEVVHLKVGGCRLTTTLATLCKDPESKLCSLFRGRDAFKRDADGAVCLDSDGLAFRYIIDFLRDGYVPLNLSTSMRLSLLREAQKYGLRALYRELGGLQNPCGTASVTDFVPLATPSERNLPTSNRKAPPLSAPPDLARPKDPSETILYSDFFPTATRKDRQFVRLRYGHEYSGDWIVSSPRNLPGVPYEMHDACLARTPIEAMNRMSKVGYRPIDFPPRLPPVSSAYTDKWVILMYKDCGRDLHGEVRRTASGGSSTAPYVAPSPAVV